MGWKLFKNPEFFAQIGRMGTARLLDRFAPEFTTQGVQIPDGELPEKEYFKAVASLGASKSGFPDKLQDVIYGIHELGSETGKDRLIRAASAKPELCGGFGQNTTCEEFAVLFYLSASALFEKTVRETQILARSSFQVFGSSDPEPAGKLFSVPTEEQMRLFKADVDEWVAKEYRGEERATQIEHYKTEDEHLFLIRVGESSTRQAVVEDDNFTYRYFRPARDLVVTYAPARDEVRINGKGAKKIRMLRETFGRRFFGKPDKFSVKDPFTLAPLVLLKAAALEVARGQPSRRMGEQQPTARYSFQPAGSMCDIVFDGCRVFHLKPTDGAIYLNYLLHNPNKPIRAFDLEREIKPGKAVVREENSIQTTVDAQAKREARQELVALAAELEEAEADGHAAKVKRLKDEIAKVKAVAGNESVLGGETGERARDNVRKAIERVIAKMRKGNKDEQAFGVHIGRFVSLGYDVSYNQPEKIKWE